jgi:hypothetical protein
VLGFQLLIYFQQHPRRAPGRGRRERLRRCSADAA